MTFEKGQPGGPGRPKGSIDRTKAILDGIVKKMADVPGMSNKERYEVVAEWIATLDDKVIAMLFAKTVINIQEIDIGPTIEEFILENDRRLAEHEAGEN